MEQSDEMEFEALPQRVGANKAKRRRKGGPTAADAATEATASQQQSDAGAAPAAAAAAAAAAAGGGSGEQNLSTGFGLHNISQQQLGSNQEQHVEDAQQYRSAAVGEHKFECE
jgi:hypothetical protein